MTIPVAAFAKRVAAEKPSPVKGAGQLFLRLAPALLALVCLLWSSSARADATLNIANGSIGLRTEGGALQYKQGTGGWTAYTGTLTIEGQKDAQGGIAVSANTVSVTSGAHTVKFNDLAITSGSGAPAGVSSGATLNLILKGTNTLISNVFDFAGLAVPSGATLAISADGNGSLTVNGGGNGAGIGGGWDASGGTVTINGGTLTVNGGDCGAGIGGGGRGSGGAVTINGGTLNVKGGDSGAGIGGGWGVLPAARSRLTAAWSPRRAVPVAQGSAVAMAEAATRLPSAVARLSPPPTNTVRAPMARMAAQQASAVEQTVQAAQSLSAGAASAQPAMSAARASAEAIKALASASSSAAAPS